MDDRSKNNGKIASIIILSYNSKDDLKECIPSILEQSYTDFEVILVDNSSTDGSPEFLKVNYPNLKLIETGANLGYAAGNNIGFQHAKGKYIVVVNPDTVVGQNWLSELVKPLEKDPDIAITTPKILMHCDKYLINTCANHSHFTGLNFCSGLNRPSSSISKPIEVGAISGCSFAIRRDVVEKLGGLDSDFFLYLEDDDISWRARLSGYKIMLVPSSVIYHKYKSTIAPRKEYYLERNRYLMLLKNYKIKTLILIFPALIFTEFLTWGHAFLNGMPYIYSKLGAYFWVLVNIKKIIEKREEVQKYRTISDKELVRLLEWKIPFEQVIKNRFMKRIADLTFNSFYKLYFKAIIKFI